MEQGIRLNDHVWVFLPSMLLTVVVTLTFEHRYGKRADMAGIVGDSRE